MQIGERVAIVTGAASGIGRATALALARAGARGVGLADLDEAGLEETASGVRDAGAAALALRTDVCEPADLERLYARTAAELGAFTILHNNAGVATGHPPWPEMEVAAIERLVDVNLKGVIVGTRLALEPMRAAGGGVVVNTASIAGHAPLPQEAAYCATKAGVEMFTRCCAPLLESHRVRVACVCPGLVETPLLRTSREGGDVVPHVRPICEILELLDPSRIAAAVIALVEDDGAVARVVDVPNEPRS